MKRLILLHIMILPFVMLYCWDGTVADSFAGGSGTQTDPYQIRNAEQLAFLAKQVNDNHITYQGNYFIQTNDIDLFGIVGNDTVQWIPIGTFNDSYETDGNDAADSHHPFLGSYDGNNHTISNLYVNNSELICAGVFGHVGHCKLRNVIVENVFVSVRAYASGVCGLASYDTFIENCHVKSGKIIANGMAQRGYSYVGGIVGKMKSFKNDRFSSYNYDNYYYFYDSGISNCTNKADIIGNANYFYNDQAGIGGIVGVAWSHRGSTFSDIHYNRAEANSHSITIKKCINYGHVTAVFASGGICGYFSDGNASLYRSCNSVVEIDSCLNYGDFISHKDFETTSTTQDQIGGIVGFLDHIGIIQNCLNAGGMKNVNIYPLDEKKFFDEIQRGIGGIVGYSNRGGGIIRSCVNIGFFESEGYSFGGICGRTSGKIEYCLNAGGCKGLHPEKNSYGGGANGGIVGYIHSNESASSSYPVHVSECISVYFDDYARNSITPITNQLSYSSPRPTNLYQQKIKNCYYDQQWLSYNWEEYTEGQFKDGNKMTSQMSGNSLKGYLSDDHWIFTDGMYPIPKGTEGFDIALLAATPILLKDSSSGQYENMYNINCDLTIGNTISDITWTSESPVIINGYKVSVVDTVAKDSMYELVAHLGDAKRIYHFQMRSIGTNDTISISAQDEYEHDGQKYTESGQYTFQYETMGGCDSIVTIDLHIDKTPPPTPKITPKATFSNNIRVCQSERDFNIDYSITEGEAHIAQITFSADAQKQAFENSISELHDSYITISLPDNCQAGNYYCEIILEDTISHLLSEMTKVEFTIILDGYLHCKWGTVLLVDNNPDNGKPSVDNDLKFKEFHWYVNGEEIQGANEQYIYFKNGLSGVYSALLTTTDGQVLQTCELEFNTQKRYPCLKSSLVDNELPIEIDNDNDGVVLYSIISASGQLISEGKAYNIIKAPINPGFYTIVLTDELGRRTVEKIICK